MNTETQKFTAESQKERWAKYGLNVLLTILIVVLLAGLVTYLGQRFDKRIDTTSAGLYSLKPQTINLIRDNKQKVKLISLYAAKDARQKDNPYAGPVRDLLEEYARKGSNIEYEAIDPVTQPTDAIIKEALDKYGGATKQYASFLTDFDKTQTQLKDLTGVEAAALADVSTDGLGSDDRAQTLVAVVSTIRNAIPQDLGRMQERVARAQKAKFPDYRAITDEIKDTVSLLQQREQSLARFAETAKTDATLPEVLRNYLNTAGPRFEQIRKLAEDTVTKIGALGELKVSDLQQQIKGQDLILVLGETDWKVINFEQVWVTDTRDVQAFVENQEIKPRFAGEQAVTTALLALTSNNKQKVVFVRPGGGPLTTPGMPPFQRGGPFSEIADRLRAYNYDVLEKDISGTWEMQARMQQQQVEPEPSEEDIKDACWIVLDIESGQGPSPQLNTKLAEHLRAGGSAMVLAMPGGDTLLEAFKDYGVALDPDYTIVHEMPKGERPKSADWAEEVQSAPIVFVLNKYGDHQFTQPVQSLDSIMAWAIPVRVMPVPGAKQTSLLPMPTSLNSWGEHDRESINTDKLKFDKDGPNADLSGPFFAGAAVEKDKTRLVVFGALQSFTNQVLNWPDADMLRRGVLVSRFPGNAELFNNAVFWLTHMEPMIAISPSAMQVSRIGQMGDFALGGWRIGVLLILIPGLVLTAGIWMYFVRRD